ncbi:helix-turn-helix domain-containing protein [Maritalea porphyrae]|uniref:helix-turn-helix domain-containing protein n=1 Tax=Maritalea porphyrae TaxID=880732 RepID=UPI0022AE7D7E|nr:helix-turn-helix domain-containing protein [Maritalea porphyrae]MCZ4273712.1 helix-turn-helix domain-containing protein [Maritalea porphyrae]
MDAVISEFTAIATIAIALFGAVICWTQSRFQKVYRSFSLFLLFVALNNLPSAIERALELAQFQHTDLSFLPLSLFSSLSLAPSFWLYVHVLTSNDQNRPNYLSIHMVLPSLAGLAGLALWFVPFDMQTAMLRDDLTSISDWAITVFAFVGILELTAYVQLAIYVVLVVRRLLHYRQQLKDVYASTEQHELNWIIVIGLFSFVFWLVQLQGLLALLGIYEALFSPVLYSVAGFALFCTAAFWGLRQRPALVANNDDNFQAEQENRKYENSALTADALERIENRLRAAMRDEQLHKNPNLSLWDLAQHVGASPNYISQTLNTVMNQNFFDFVNSYRIEDAKHLLAHSEASVLAITYDVGFNSRSSFYMAFKKVTGHTPSAYRKNCPNGHNETTS